jgi:ppGpp synthetase/RelA/SpoT-type nucleotidyltranferase
VAGAVSNNALKKLGDRIASGDPVSDSDLEMLNQFIASCDGSMERAGQIVGEAGFAATSRLKTRTTLIEKLRRDPTTKLPSVQDVAGLRVTVTDRIAQDDAVARIETALENAGCSYRTRDRRDDPSYGYRAVHVVATVDGVRVEIQVRTELQDVWAQVAEKMGDVYGRQIRYGGQPDAGATPGETAARQELVGRHRGPVSENMADIEQRLAQVHRGRAEFERLQAELDQVTAEQDPDLPANLRARADDASDEERAQIDQIVMQYEATKARLIAIREAMSILSVQLTARRAELDTVVTQLMNYLQDQVDQISTEAKGL